MPDQKMSPLERAAAAVYDIRKRPGRAGHGTEDRAIVRAVIAAIRDVDAGSPAILIAGKQALFCCTEDPELEHARKVWHAMIDAALKE